MDSGITIYKGVMSDNILGGADSENVIWGIILRDFLGDLRGRAKSSRCLN